MANVVKETYLGQVQQNEGSANSSLDKLAQLGKRAARKFVQKPIIEALIEISAEQKDAKTRKGTPWVKQFSNILKCSSILKSTGDKVTARYCNSRACLVCSAIRTGKLWNKYENALKRTKEPFFVTLTQGPRVDAMELRKTIAQMTKRFQDCIGVLKKRKKNLVGFRKLEVTYETKGKHKNTYHPHFHCLVDGEEQAYWLVSEWLKRNPEASAKAQDVRKWEDGDLNEMFKYITKFFDKDGKPIPAIANSVVLSKFEYDELQERVVQAESWNETKDELIYQHKSTISHWVQSTEFWKLKYDELLKKNAEERLEQETRHRQELSKMKEELDGIRLADKITTIFGNIKK